MNIVRGAALPPTPLGVFDSLEECADGTFLLHTGQELRRGSANFLFMPM